MRKPDEMREQFVGSFSAATTTMTPTLVAALLAEAEWRGRLVASWAVAVQAWRHYLPQIADLLLAAELVYASQGFCIALASLPDETGLNALKSYLDRWLVADGDRHHDQPWIMATLIHVDRELGRSESTHLLAPNGPWAKWATDSTDRFLAMGTAWLSDALALVEMCRARLGLAP